MKQLRLLILSIGIFTGVSAQQITSLAILDFEGRGIAAHEAASLTDWLRSEIVGLTVVPVIERGDMLEVLMGEQDLRLTGCTSDDCAVQVGQILGVTHMLAGSIGQVGSTFIILARLIDVETGQIMATANRRIKGTLDDLLDEMPPLAKEIIGINRVSERVQPDSAESISPVPNDAELTPGLVRGDSLATEPDKVSTEQVKDSGSIIPALLFFLVVLNGFVGSI